MLNRRCRWFSLSLSLSFTTNVGLEKFAAKGRTMKRTRYSEEQIIGILTEHEAGAKCADLCRNHGMSEGTFYAWRAKYSGMTVSEAKRLKALEDERALSRHWSKRQWRMLTAPSNSPNSARLTRRVLVPER